MKYGWVMSGALVLALTTGAWAADNVGGMVQHVDPASRTVHFTTGEIVHVEPGAVIMISGRQVQLDQVRPGTSIVIQRGHAAAQRGTVVGQQPVTAQPQVQPYGQARVLEGHPAVDASGTVARVDEQGRVITFQDGRSFRLGVGSDVWQEGRVGQIQPGSRVLIREAQPVAMQGLGQHRMGRVQSIDRTAGQVILHDGTVVRFEPQTRFHAGDQKVTITDLRPGDEVLIVVKSPATAGNGAAALPRETVVGAPRETVVGAPAPGLMGPSAIMAEDVRIYRHRQSP